MNTHEWIFTHASWSLSSVTLSCSSLKWPCALCCLLFMYSWLMGEEDEDDVFLPWTSCVIWLQQQFYTLKNQHSHSPSLSDRPTGRQLNSTCSPARWSTILRRREASTSYHVSSAFLPSDFLSPMSPSLSFLTITLYSCFVSFSEIYSIYAALKCLSSVNAVVSAYQLMMKVTFFFPQRSHSSYFFS